MLSQFKHHIGEFFPFLTKSKIVIAVSGGIDSVVLTHLCHQTGFDIVLAHCNFKLRGHESDDDEAFVLQFAEQLGLEAFVQHFDTEIYAEQHKSSIQMAARELRYNWFTELVARLGFDCVLTAHHADDNLETFLINFVRGTGLEGLTGIPEINGIFVRPLLPFSRIDIANYAKGNKLSWVEDKTNSSTKYLRNKLRHEIVPVLKAINPSLLNSFAGTLGNLSDSANIISERIDIFLDRAIIKVTNTSVVYNISVFKNTVNPKAYLYEVFKVYGFTQWRDITDLLNAQSGKMVFSNTHRLIKDRDVLLLSKIVVNEEKAMAIPKNTQEIQMPLGILFFEQANQVTKKEKHIIYVDKDKLEFPLTLRRKQEGDTFFPLGMKGKKKKLSKYFKDEKLSLLEKENTWLLCSGNDIVWVINRRADNRFKVTETTRTILKIELQ
ncbi:MAG: tRNA lysidine(34) synthetase TilS [Aestuariibaculum sp.]